MSRRREEAELVRALAVSQAVLVPESPPPPASVKPAPPTLSTVRGTFTPSSLAYASTSAAAAPQLQDESSRHSRTTTTTTTTDSIGSFSTLEKQRQLPQAPVQPAASTLSVPFSDIRDFSEEMSERRKNSHVDLGHEDDDEGDDSMHLDGQLVLEDSEHERDPQDPIPAAPAPAPARASSVGTKRTFSIEIPPTTKRAKSAPKAVASRAANRLPSSDDSDSAEQQPVPRPSAKTSEHPPTDYDEMPLQSPVVKTKKRESFLPAISSDGLGHLEVNKTVAEVNARLSDEDSDFEEGNSKRKKKAKGKKAAPKPKKPKKGVEPNEGGAVPAAAKKSTRAKRVSAPPPPPPPQPVEEDALPPSDPPPIPSTVPSPLKIRLTLPTKRKPTQTLPSLPTPSLTPGDGSIQAPEEGTSSFLPPAVSANDLPALPPPALKRAPSTKKRANSISSSSKPKEKLPRVAEGKLLPPTSESELTSNHPSSSLSPAPAAAKSKRRRIVQSDESDFEATTLASEKDEQKAIENVDALLPSQDPLAIVGSGSGPKGIVSSTSTISAAAGKKKHKVVTSAEKVVKPKKAAPLKGKGKGKGKAKQVVQSSDVEEEKEAQDQPLVEMDIDAQADDEAEEDAPSSIKPTSSKASTLSAAEKRKADAQRRMKAVMAASKEGEESSLLLPPAQAKMTGGKDGEAVDEEDEDKEKSEEEGEAAKNNENKAPGPVAPTSKSASTGFTKPRAAGTKKLHQKGLAGLLEKTGLWGSHAPGMSRTTVAKTIPRLHLNLKPPPPAKPALPKKRETKKKKEDGEDSEEDKPWYETKHHEEWDSDDHAEYAKIVRWKEKGYDSS